MEAPLGWDWLDRRMESLLGVTGRDWHAGTVPQQAGDRKESPCDT
jgi:hypothetical protein